MLEDGSTWQKVLETHPQWVGGGWIMGMYPQQTVPANVQLTVRIGFISGATGTDGALFKVYFDEFIGMQVPPTRHTVISQFAILDNALDLVTKDLGYLAGRKGNFILYVNAGQTSNRDWAVWAEAKIESTAMPDLVVTNIIRSDSSIRYKVKNIGDATTTAKSFSNALNVDGKQVAEDTISQTLQPGQEVESGFDYAFQPEPGQHVIKVCADSKQNVDESNEQNNCLEETWVEEKLPDLVIIEVKCDRNNSIVGYVLKNIGDETAGGGHQTTLYVDGNEETHDLVGVDLKSGETYESWLKEYEWPECHNISVKVCADNYNQVKESDEANNFLERVCVSYAVPIMVTSGPNAVDATQDSITIAWVTNKKSDSLVRYSDRSTGEELSIYDANLVKSHQVKIEGLEPMTTYRFCVESKDLCGNTVSRKGAFETESPPDDENPSVDLFLPERLVGVVEILANASDNVGVAGVMFSMDGAVKLIDLSLPYVWSCNTSLFTNGVHGFSARAYDVAGNDATDAKNGTIDNPIPDTNPPAISIVNPHGDDQVLGMVRIEAIIQEVALIHEPIGYVKGARIYVDGNYSKGWTYAPFVYDFLRGEVVVAPPVSRLILKYLWNTTGLAMGSSHTIEVVAWDDSENYRRASVNVTIKRIEWEQPPLELRIIALQVTREVARRDNYFLVTLKVRNVGTEDLYNFTIRDDVSGFQVIPLQPFSTVRYAPSFWSSIVIWKPEPLSRLSPGGIGIFMFYAVPILFDPPIPDNCYIFGWLPTSVSFMCDGVLHSKQFEVPYSPGLEDLDGTGAPDLAEAFGCSDYLIVTDPSRLFGHNPSDGDGVNTLLTRAAELARLKCGVLGYLRGSETAVQLKAAISPGGRWASRLCHAFGSPDVENAYLLIVGETEIVPAYDYPDTRISDHYYSDTVGEDGVPDLIVGRMIGDNANNLACPINTSIAVLHGHGFDRRSGLATSGYEDGPWYVLVQEAGDIARDLEGQGFVDVRELHWGTFIEHAWTVDFRYDDAFALGDVDGDRIDEVIIARHEENVICVYEPGDRTLVRSFAPDTHTGFTPYDGFAAGDLDGDGIDEIVIATNSPGEEGAICVYEPDGTLVDASEAVFNEWDCLAVGDVSGDSREEVVTASESQDRLYLYALDGGRRLRLDHSCSIDIDFAQYDGFAVGNARQALGKDEIMVFSYSDQTIYLYNWMGGRIDEVSGDLNGEGGSDVHLGVFDGFAAGDVDEDGEDEMVVVCGEQNKIYVYWWGPFDHPTEGWGERWGYTAMYSRFFGDWFYGARYTGRLGTLVERHDGFALGDVIDSENPKIVILRNRDGDLSSFEVLVSTWPDADEWANERLRPITPSISILTLSGHGNAYGCSPTGVYWERMWDFTGHPFVFSMSCSTGNYEEGGDSFGEALFRKGAAVLVGATEISDDGLDHEASCSYFESWWDIWRESAGYAFTEYERSRAITRDGGWRFWVREYNYYGDPKFPSGG